MSRFTLKFWIFNFWIFKFYPINPILVTIYFILHLNWVMTWIDMWYFFFIYYSVYRMLSHFLTFLMTLVYKSSLQKWQLFLPKVFHAYLLSLLFVFVQFIKCLNCIPSQEFSQFFISVHCKRLYLYLSSNQSYMMKTI